MYLKAKKSLHTTTISSFKNEIRIYPLKKKKMIKYTLCILFFQILIKIYRVVQKKFMIMSEAYI